MINTENMQLEMLKKTILSKILSGEAIERLARVRLANPLLASQVELYFIELYQAGKLREQVTDEKLRQILDMLTTKRQTRIVRR